MREHCCLFLAMLIHIFSVSLDIFGKYRTEQWSNPFKQSNILTHTHTHIPVYSTYICHTDYRLTYNVHVFMYVYDIYIYTVHTYYSPSCLMLLQMAWGNTFMQHLVPPAVLKCRLSKLMLEHLLEHPLTVRRFVQQWNTVNMYLNHEMFIDFEVFQTWYHRYPKL